MMLAQVPGSKNASLCTAEIDLAARGAHRRSLRRSRDRRHGRAFDVFTGETLSKSSPTSEFLAVKETHFNPAFDPNAPQKRQRRRRGHPRRRRRRSRPSRTTAPPSRSRWCRGRCAWSATASPRRSDTKATSAGTRRTAPDTLAAARRPVRLPAGHGARHLRGRLGRAGAHDPRRRRAHHRHHVVRLQRLPDRRSQPPMFAGNDTRIDAYAGFIDPWVPMFDPPAEAAGATCRATPTARRARANDQPRQDLRAGVRSGGDAVEPAPRAPPAPTSTAPPLCAAKPRAAAARSPAPALRWAARRRCCSSPSSALFARRRRTGRGRRAAEPA